MKRSDQQTLENWRWLYERGYQRGFADAEAAERKAVKEMYDEADALCDKPPTISNGSPT